MSTLERGRWERLVYDERLPTPARAGAIAAAAVLTFSYLTVLYRVVDVVGSVIPFVVIVVSALALGGTLAHALSVRAAVGLGATLLVGGLSLYLAMVPQAYIDFARIFGDTIALLTGLSVLRMTKAGVWALGFTPGPLFVSWYFFFRREYALGALVAGAALGFFVLTGDAGTMLTLAGVLGAFGAVGFGRLDQRGGGITRSELSTLIAVTITMLVVTTSLSIVPGGQARPLLTDQRSSTVEGSLLDTDEQVSILGSIQLSATARYTVTADRASYWRADAYDRYTGGDWIRTGDTIPYTRPLDRPPGDARRLTQVYRAESDVGTMPAAWKPVRVGSSVLGTRVTETGGLDSMRSFSKGDRYSITSFAPEWTEQELRNAPTTYPDAIESRYLQIPDSTPDRVTERTAEITADADNPYDTAVAIERYLESQKGYSLDVRRPQGDIADSFLFEMERGYCTYFATTMITMLRTQGIPARFVVGYTPGQQVDQNTWVVRGFDSHAWVEVYFPGTGWVTFDPTPAGPRQAAENARLEQARATGEENVDTPRSAANGSDAFSVDPDPSDVAGGGLSTQDITTTPSLDTNDSDAAPNVTLEDGLAPQSADDSGSAGQSGFGFDLPSQQTLLYGLILLAGVVMVAYWLGVFDRIYRVIWLRRRPTGSPEARVEAAFDRIEYLLARHHRPRRDDETPREYLEAIGRQSTFAGGDGSPHDDRILRLFDIYERTRYGGTVDDGTADAATQLAQELAREWSHIP